MKKKLGTLLQKVCPCFLTHLKKVKGTDPSLDDPKGMVESPTGYLCHNHILYLTHEPCVMCSMALLHSRIGLVIFDGANKACEAGLGGLCSGELDSSCPVSPIGPLDDETAIESSTPPPPEKKEHNGEYGLFWRKELNWKFLVYEWREKHQNLHQSLSNSGGGEGLTEELEDGQVSGIALLKKLAQLDVSECKIGRDVHA